MEYLNSIESVETVSDKAREAFEEYTEYFDITDEELHGPILDVGTGHGYFVRYLRDVLGNREAYGIENQAVKIDPSKDGVMEGDGLDLPFEDGTFKIVVAKNYLPMFADKPEKMKMAIDELIRVTAPGGKVMGNIPLPEDELKMRDTVEGTKNKEWIDRRYAGAIYLRNLLEEYLKRGLSISYKNGVRNGYFNYTIVVIEKAQ